MKQQEQYTDKSLMPYGKHKDEPLIAVPAGYLIFIFENHDLTRYPALKEYINQNMDVLKVQEYRDRQKSKRR